MTKTQASEEAKAMMLQGEICDESTLQLVAEAYADLEKKNRVRELKKMEKAEREKQKEEAIARKNKKEDAFMAIVSNLVDFVTAEPKQQQQHHDEGISGPMLTKLIKAVTTLLSNRTHFDRLLEESLNELKVLFPNTPLFQWVQKMMGENFVFTVAEFMSLSNKMMEAILGSKPVAKMFCIACRDQLLQHQKECDAKKDDSVRDEVAAAADDDDEDDDDDDIFTVNDTCSDEEDGDDDVPDLNQANKKRKTRENENNKRKKAKTRQI